MSIIVRCTRGAADKEAEPISDALISNRRVAALRGKRFLDDPDQGGYYVTKERRLSVPHRVSGETSDNHVAPGEWVTVTNSHLDLYGASLRVRSYELTIEPGKIKAVMETQEFIEVADE